MSDIIHIKMTLVDRLKTKGVDPGIIPWFIKNLARTMKFDSHMNLSQINSRLKWLGWDDVELDYHTYQLAKACFESEGINGIEN
jgi:hypothetical protein